MKSYNDINDFHDEHNYTIIVNGWNKVGNVLERWWFGFTDYEDEDDIKYLAHELTKPLRHGLFENCAISEIFPMVKINE